MTTDVLNTALAKARGTLEFDAYRRAYGGHVRVGSADETRDRAAAAGNQGDRPARRVGAGARHRHARRAWLASSRSRSSACSSWPSATPQSSCRQKADLASTLLASLCHDLKTPLTAIRTAVENLSGDLPQPMTGARRRSAAITELDRLTRLLQDILDMARIDAAAIRVNRQWVTAADVVDAAIAHVRHALDGRAARRRRRRHGCRDRSAASRRSRLSHLLENAALYSPRDSEIDVEARSERRWPARSVTDHGPGLDPGELDHLFERFYRGRAARQAAFGTGMGLSITRGLLAAAGGRVWAENVPGAGARFTIVVPGATRPAHGGATDMAARILVVDDEPNILATVAPLLRGARLRCRVGDDRPRGARRLRPGRNPISWCSTSASPT